MIGPIHALNYARRTTNLALAWLSNKNKQTILPTFDTYLLHLHRDSPGSRW